MRIKREILLKHFTDASIEQITADYQEAGYEVVREHRLGDFVADLVATKGDELIVFQFKSKHWEPARIEWARRLRNYVVHQLGASLRLVLVTPPGELLVEIEDLEQLLLDLVSDEASLYDELATHVHPDEVSDVEFGRIAIRKDGIELLGFAVVSLKLQYGSDGDLKRGDGLRSSESFPLSFNILLSPRLDVKEVLSLELDIKDYYG